MTDKSDVGSSIGILIEATYRTDISDTIALAMSKGKLKKVLAVGVCRSDTSRAKDMFGSSHDSDQDSGDRDLDFDHRVRPRAGRGASRSDSPFASAREESFMPMTRRDADADVDVDRIRDHALRDTSSFLKSRDEHTKKERSTKEQVLSIGEMLLGAVLGGYASQRFRATSGAVPTGLLLGGVMYGAAQFTQLFGRATEDVKNLAIGSALASGVIWAAGYGTLGAEKAEAKTEGNFPATGGAPPPYAPQQMQPPPQAWPAPAYQPSAYAPPPAVAAWGAQRAAPTVRDFQALVMQRGA